jgi:hypothetical protein
MEYKERPAQCGGEADAAQVIGVVVLDKPTTAFVKRGLSSARKVEKDTPRELALESVSGESIRWQVVNGMYQGSMVTFFLVVRTGSRFLSSWISLISKAFAPDRIVGMGNTPQGYRASAQTPSTSVKGCFYDKA